MTGRGCLAWGEITRLVTQIRKAGLEMKRYGVVDLSTDAGGLEVRLQRVALWCSNHELVADVAAVTPIDGQDNPGASPPRVSTTRLASRNRRR